MPLQLKEYALYRTLTGDAIKMLKEGIEEAAISETLKKEYIDPLLDVPKKKSGNRRMEKPTKRDSVKGMTDFITFPPMPSGVRQITRKRHSLLLKKIKAAHSTVEYFSSIGSDPLPRASRNVSASQFNEPEQSKEPHSRTKTTTGLIYLGRLPECKKLKIWVRPVDY